MEGLGGNGVESGGVEEGSKTIRLMGEIHKATWVELGVLFQEKVKKKIGNERNILFWEGVWVEDVSLKERFKRLFELSLQKGSYRGYGEVE